MYADTREIWLGNELMRGEGELKEAAAVESHLASIELALFQLRFLV